MKKIKRLSVAELGERPGRDPPPYFQINQRAPGASRLSNPKKLLLPLGPWPSVISASYAKVWSILTSVLNEFFDSTLCHPASTIIDRYSVYGQSAYTPFHYSDVSSKIAFNHTYNAFN